MKILKKIVVGFLGFILFLYLLLCLLLYVYQEKLIFFPTKLSSNFEYKFSQNFEEISILTTDKIKLNGLLFKVDSSKGVIFYLHGNAGALDTWADVAPLYTSLHYDVFLLDYRGFGKSESVIKNEEQFYLDIQTAYDAIKNRYDEKKMIVLGYSIGTGSAAMLASKNHPKQLILQAPYYSLIDMMTHSYPIVPTFLLKYKFKTYEFVQQTKSPIVIFHGNEDEVIYYGSSLKLKPFLKPTDTLITLDKAGHNGMTDNLQYQLALKKILN